MLGPLGITQKCGLNGQGLIALLMLLQCWVCGWRHTRLDDSFLLLGRVWLIRSAVGIA